MPGRIAPAVPSRSIVRTPASASSWKSRIAPGAPTPCEETTTSVPCQVPVKVRYSRWYDTSFASDSSSATAAASARVADHDRLGGQAGARDTGDGQGVGG